MKKVLIVYYSIEQKKLIKNDSIKTKSIKEPKSIRITNEEKVAQEFKRLFEEKNFLVESINLVSKENLTLKNQFKKEKEIILLNKFPDFNKIDLVVIGTPIVGAMTSSPLINSFIRGLNFDKKQKKPFFVVYSTGIIHGFELKKMINLLGMKGIKPIQSESFCSIFDFDTKKLLEVQKFFNKIFEEIEKKN